MPIRSISVLAALAALAAAPARAADPLDAKARVAPLTHRSAFAAYRGHDDVKPVPWREANDTVGRIGGWRAYAREAAASEPPAATPGTTPPARPAAPAGAGDTPKPPAGAASAPPTHRHH